MICEKNGFTEWLIQKLAQPLGLKCCYKFTSKDVVLFLNGKRSPKFEDHVNDCWVCLARILLFIEISEFLHNITNTTGSYNKLALRCMEKIDKSYTQNVEVPQEWLSARINHVGEEAFIWLKDGQIKLEIVKPSGEKDSFSPVQIGKLFVRSWRDFVRRRIWHANTPSVTIAYPDPITVSLMKVFPSS